MIELNIFQIVLILIASSKLMSRNLNRVMGIILLSVSVYYFVKL